MPVSGLTLRLVKGSPLESTEMDQNLTILRDAHNALEQLFLTVLNPDGSLKSGAINSANIIADGIITAVKLAADAKIPAGTIVAFGGSSAPSGWVECDGSAISRTTYAALFAAVSTTWGVGDGSLTFNVPDLRGRVPMGSGTGSGLTARTLGQSLGEEEHLLTAEESGVQEHLHGVPWRDNTAGAGSANATGTMTNAVVGTEDSETAEADAVESHNNIQPSAVVKFIIKT